MRKIALSFMLVLVFVLSLISVEGAIRNEARIAGYHNISYIERIQTVDDTIANINIMPQTLNIGWGTALPGRYMRIFGDGSGNYSFDSAWANTRFIFLDPVNMNSILTVNNDARAVRFCDVSGANCFTGSLVVGMYNNITNLQTNVTDLQNFRRNIYVNVTNVQNLWIQSGGNVYRSSGNVGIGTNNPTQALDVSGNVRSSGYYTSSGNFVIRLS